MTREYRTRLAAGGGPPQKTPTFATVRVRLPEGLLLQGEFNAGEPVRDISWTLGRYRALDFGKCIIPTVECCRNLGLAHCFQSVLPVWATPAQIYLA